MSSPSPFEISIPSSELQRLHQKLALTDFPDEVSDISSNWSRGVPLSEIKRLIHYWQNSFDWRAAEARLNTFPQFTTAIEVEGFGVYDVHFIHQKSAVENAIPLMFLHGWPGSFVEVTKMLPELLKGGEEGEGPAFDVVAPSLIDFGFSAASKKESFNADQHAEACHKLMLSLGYSEYVIQAGDLGHLIARFIALKYGPKHCKATHLNSALPAEPTATSHPELYAELEKIPLDKAEIAGLMRTKIFSEEGNGYLRIQSTKPQTIGYSLTDSPVGLLAWIYEKMHGWSDNYPWSDDEILTWVSIYYFSTAGPSASSYLYYENEHRNPSAFAAMQVYINVPLGIASFEKDVIVLPKAWNRTLGPIVFESVYERGGHFAAWERPDAIVHDLKGMFGKEREGYWTRLSNRRKNEVDWVRGTLS
ncbi:Alpha/Beta hydrolase protein [Tricladium varicosporioides]|nr:Alpha/Beta hydrolase protein [Hymenoscyphus varicosporioides]